MPGSSVPAVYVQLVAVRIVPARVSVPAGLLMTTRGRLPPAAVVAAPVRVWAPAPLMSRVAVPPLVGRGLAESPWAARVPVPLRLPAVRVSGPLTVSVVPAAMVVVARKSTALRVWQPLIVPPAKTSVEVPGSSVPAVYVQLLAVRIVPARVSVPDGLLMTTRGRLPLRSWSASR